MGLADRLYRSGMAVFLFIGMIYMTMHPPGCSGHNSSGRELRLAVESQNRADLALPNWPTLEGATPAQLHTLEEGYVEALEHAEKIDPEDVNNHFPGLGTKITTLYIPALREYVHAFSPGAPAPSKQAYLKMLQWKAAYKDRAK